VERLQAVGCHACLAQTSPYPADVHIEAAVITAVLTLQNHTVEIRLAEHLPTLKQELPKQPKLQGRQREVIRAGACM